MREVRTVSKNRLQLSALLTASLLSLTFLLPENYVRAQHATAFEAALVLHADQPKTRINRNLYGQFAEHLGRVIYDGSGSAKTRGFRTPAASAMTSSQPSRNLTSPFCVGRA